MSQLNTARALKMKLMEPKHTNKGTELLGGEMSGIVNWNDIRYPQMYRSYKAILSNFWIPERISMMQDVKQWDTLTDREKDAFERSLGQLATLDSMQTRAVAMFSNFVSEPTYHPIAAVIAQQEAVHNESYSYVLSSLVNNGEQNRIFNDAKDDKRVQKRNKRVQDVYEKFSNDPTHQNFFEALVACIVLEGINFYSTFTFFYALSREQKMLGTSAMINYIQRDEVQHAYFFSQILRYLMAEHPELHTEDNIEFIYDFVVQGVDDEIEWSRWALRDIDGVDLDELEGYIKNLANRRLRGMGLDNHYEGVSNSMPWMMSYDDDALAMTKSDFFEKESRSYSKADGDNDLDDI